MDRFDKVYATFWPKRTDNLKPGVAECIGWRGVWKALWIIEEGDGNPAYVGQWAMAPSIPASPFAWTPEEDLEDVSDAIPGRELG